MQEMQVPSLDREDPLEKEVVTHSSIFAWEIPWTEEPGRLQTMGLQKVRPSDWARIEKISWYFCYLSIFLYMYIFMLSYHILMQHSIISCSSYLYKKFMLDLIICVSCMGLIHVFKR